MSKHLQTYLNNYSYSVCRSSLSLLGTCTLLVLFLFNVGQIAHAGDPVGFGKVHVVTQSPNSDGQPPLFNKNRKCAIVFKSPGKAHLLNMEMGKISDNHTQEPYTSASAFYSDELMDVQAEAIASILSVPTSKPAEIHSHFFERAMYQWRDHGYSEEQVQLLRALNNQLAPQRVHWIQFQLSPEDLPNFDLTKIQMGLSSIRIFDGSQPFTKALGHEVRYFEPTLEDFDPNNLKEALTPIELSPRNLNANYLLPQRPRSQVRPEYLWHLGIGTNVRLHQSGLIIMFSHVAKLLDIHYNNSFMKTFNSSDAVSNLNMMIYSSSKPELVPYYKELGFRVLTPQGEEFETSIIEVDSQSIATIKENSDYPLLPDGMVLIAFQADAFLEKYYALQDVPHVRIEDSGKIFELGGPNNQESETDFSHWLQENQSIKNSLETIHDPQVLAQKISDLRNIYIRYNQAVFHFLRKNPNLDHSHINESEYFKDYNEYKSLTSKYRELVVLFYKIVFGMEERYRRGDWTILRDYSIALLNDKPLEATVTQTIRQDLQTGEPDFIKALEHLLL